MLTERDRLTAGMIKLEMSILRPPSLIPHLLLIKPVETPSFTLAAQRACAT